MANVQMDYKDFPLKQCGFSLKLRADSAPVIGPMSALGVKLGSVAATCRPLVRMLGRSLGALWHRRLVALVTITHRPRDAGGLRLNWGPLCRPNS